MTATDPSPFLLVFAAILTATHLLRRFAAWLVEWEDRRTGLHPWARALDALRSACGGDDRP